MNDMQKNNRLIPEALIPTEKPIGEANPQAPVALVIGSGFGGLAAAVRMCA
jgi:hypothetical protein